MLSMFLYLKVEDKDYIIVYNMKNNNKTSF